MHRIERLAALVLAALAGCTADTTSSEARRLEVVEDVRIGSIDDPETSLTSVRTLRTDGAGRLYSIHSNEPFVRVHDEWLPTACIARWSYIGRRCGMLFPRLGAGRLRRAVSCTRPASG
jgi:hypothetical protein